MKKVVLPLLFAMVAMGIAMFVVATLLHIDVKAEIDKIVSGATDEEPLVEAPEI